MSPKLEQVVPEGDFEVFKIGGSLLFESRSPHLNIEQGEKLLFLLQQQWNEGHGVVAIIGGGELARIRTEDARQFGIREEEHLDAIGIGISKNNARILAFTMEERGLPAVVLSGSARIYPKNRMIFRGGTEPGHTTDYVAVEAAKALRAPLIFVLSNTDGLLRSDKKGQLTSEVIPEIFLSDYLKTAPHHSPGIHTPLDRPAAELALQSGITVVLLGRDPDNIRSCMQGEQFVGTIFHPG